MNNPTPISQTPAYKAAFKQYKTNLLKYEPGINWYFDEIKNGHGFNEELTLEIMQEMAKKVSPVGPAVSSEEVVDITPSWKEYEKIVGPTWDYAKYEAWTSAQTDAFYYGRGKDNFNVWEAYKIAASLGYKKVIMENYS